MFAFAPTETVGNAPYLTTALGGIEIKVVDADLEAAQALLADINTADGPAPVERKPLSTIAGEVISTFGFGVPPASPPRRKKGA